MPKIDRAEQSRAEQSRAEQSRAEQSRAEQSRRYRYAIIAVILIGLVGFSYIVATHPGFRGRLANRGYYAYAQITDFAHFYKGRTAIATGDATINVIGDSLTEGYKNHEVSYVASLAYLTEANTVNNYGIGGSTVSSYVADLHPMCERYSEMDKDADYIVIFAGNNDFTQSVPLGDADSTDTNTFYGALNVMLAGLRDMYPTGRFLYVTPLRMWHYNHPKWDEPVEYDSKNKVGLTLADYRAAIINRCEYYEIPYLDLYNEGLYGRTDATRAAVYVDGLHPNSEGHRQIATKIAARLKSL